MGLALRILTSVTLAGTVVGGAVALDHVPKVQQTASSSGDKSAAAGDTLKSLLKQSADLHAAIDSARIADSSSEAPPPPDPHPNAAPHPTTGRAPVLNALAPGRRTSHPPSTKSASRSSTADEPDPGPTIPDESPDRTSSIPSLVTIPRPAVTPTATVTSGSPTRTRSPRPSPTGASTTQPGGGDD